MNQKLTWKSMMITCAMLSGCASAPSLLHEAEKELDTGGETTKLFHSVLYYPSEISLHFPGYIVGIEKSPIDRVARNGDINIRAYPEANLSKEEAQREIVDEKILYVSHVIESKTNGFGIENCTLHDAYFRNGHQELMPLVMPCAGGTPKEIPATEAYIRSWSALDTLRHSIQQQALSNKHTHIVVVVMGWNTVQEEAVRNFNSIMKNLKIAGGDKFNPLFVGVTWPSQWKSAWLPDILLQPFSFGTKKGDADELGLTWLGVLLHDTLSDVKNSTGKELPLVVIGHSFGARATSVAACGGPAIANGEKRISRKNIAALVNYQGAYRISRLLANPEDRGFLFTDKCKNVGQVILTSSKNDTAMNTAFWGNYAGDDVSYKESCEGEKKEVNCATAKPTGELARAHRNGSHITYVRADNIIRFNAYSSGGGAHSDIYRREHGILAGQFLFSPKDTEVGKAE